MNWSERVVLTLALVIAQSVSAQGSAPTGVTINVTVDQAGKAHVQEQYRLPGDTSGLQLQHLARACARVGEVRLVSATGELKLASSARGPWVSLRDSSIQRNNASDFQISYDVDL